MLRCISNGSEEKLKPKLGRFKNRFSKYMGAHLVSEVKKQIRVQSLCQGRNS
jgi:hypothetical protein